MQLFPAKTVGGEVILPGDKSVSHRAAMICSMAEGESEIDNYSQSADCASTLECLRELGVKIEQSGAKVVIKGVGKKGFSAPTGPLNCGNSGTTMRLMAGILAGQNFESELIGDESLGRRPMKRIIGPLEKMGAAVGSRNGLPPLRIAGRDPLKPAEHHLKVASAQVKSCILLAGLNASGETAVIEPVPTRDHTERMLSFLGCGIRISECDDGRRISISGESRVSAGHVRVPADISAAAFFLTAAACLPGSRLLIRNVGLNPTRSAILDVLIRLGVDITISGRREVCNEPIGDIAVCGNSLSDVPKETPVISGKIISNLIDELPILAVFGTQLPGGLEVRNAEELRIKESDRIAAVVGNLRRMKSDVEEFPDGFRVSRSSLAGANVDSMGDHRIAMAFAVAALFAKGPTTIENAECASVSFPDFFPVLEAVVERL